MESGDSGFLGCTAAPSVEREHNEDTVSVTDRILAANNVKEGATNFNTVSVNLTAQVHILSLFHI